MKVLVKRACGHEEQVEVFGTTKERENKIKWYEATDCTSCYSKAANSNCEEIEMTYSEYKNNYADCKTKPNSYNKSTKTIIVYVPKKAEETNETIVNEVKIEEIAEAFGTTVNNVKVMIAKSETELENHYETLKIKLIQIKHPQREELINKTRKAIDLIYKYKAQ